MKSIRELIARLATKSPSWATFLRAHWGEIAAADFFTTEVWAPRGLVTVYTLFMIDRESRRVRIAGSTRFPGDAFMVEVARNLRDSVDGFLLGRRCLICDRDRSSRSASGRS